MRALTAALALAALCCRCAPALACVSTRTQHKLMYILPPFRGPFEYDEVWRHDPLYTAEFWFFEAATRDDRWVACTPELATYFYLPFFNVRTNHNGPTSWGLVREAAAGARAALRGRLGAWTNFTTVLFQQVDYGTCATPPEFAAVRFLTHFGLRRFPAEPSQWARVATGGHSTAPCFVDAAQTLTPGHCWGCGNRLTAALCAEQQNSSEQQRRQQPNRTWTLVFQGQLRDAAGARQELWLRLKDEPGFLVAASRGPGGGGGRDWAALMAASHFCAAPHGDGWGSRLVSALSVGCIPVLMLGDSARPFDALLDYSTFSISVVIEDIKHLPTILGRVSAEERGRMRRRALEVAPLFLWHYHNQSDPRVADAMGLVQGRAYEMTMRELGVAFGAASPEGRDRLAAAERRALAATLALPRVDCARWNPEEHRM